MSVPSSNQQGAEIRERWEGVAGPWQLESCNCCIFDAEGDTVIQQAPGPHNDVIASAPADIAWLLAERDALQAQLQAVKAWAERARALIAGATDPSCGCVDCNEARALSAAFPEAASAPGVGAAQTRTEET